MPSELQQDLHPAYQVPRKAHQDTKASLEWSLIWLGQLAVADLLRAYGTAHRHRLANQPIELPQLAALARGTRGT